MASALTTKYGPGEGVSVSTAALQLEAYARVLSAAARSAAIRAPVLRVSGEEQSGLFAPRQLAALVTRPLARADEAACEGRPPAHQHGQM